MDINNLEAFIEVAESKSFSRSAESLQLTQPAVSKRIAALESELTLKLFDRMGRSVHLTEAGEVLLPAARKITSEVSRISREISSLGKEVSGKLSIGVTQNIGLDRLARQLKNYRLSYPDVEIDLHVLSADELLGNFESGKVEIILCSANTPNPVAKSHLRLTSIEVFKEKQLVVVANAHPLARLSAVTAVELAEHSAILPQPHSLTRQSIDQMMTRHGVEASVVMEEKDTSTTRSMVANGLGWALLPQSEVEESMAVLNIADLQLNYSQELVSNSNRTLSRAAQAFFALLRT